MWHASCISDAKSINVLEKKLKILTVTPTTTRGNGRWILVTHSPEVQASITAKRKNSTSFNWKPIEDSDDLFAGSFLCPSEVRENVYRLAMRATSEPFVINHVNDSLEVVSLDTPPIHNN